MRSRQDSELPLERRMPDQSAVIADGAKRVLGEWPNKRPRGQQDGRKHKNRGNRRKRQKRYFQAISIKLCPAESCRDSHIDRDAINPRRKGSLRNGKIKKAGRVVRKQLFDSGRVKPMSKSPSKGDGEWNQRSKETTAAALLRTRDVGSHRKLPPCQRT
jgi:hypothetical protein